MSNKYEWYPRIRNYKNDKILSNLCPVFVHPLKSSTSTTNTTNFSIRTSSKDESSISGSSISLNNKTDELKNNKVTKENKFIDPLGVSLESTTLNGVQNYEIGSDPLSSTLSNHNDAKTEKIPNSLQSEPIVVKTAEPILEGFEPWSIKKNAILQKYTTNEKLTIVTSFLPGGVPVHKQVAVDSTVRMKLEQLDSFHDTSIRQIQNLSQKDYVEKINELTKALIQAWADDQRVQAIKIVIQCAKLLSDTLAVPQFYPSQFALIVDVLDTFGRLVYDRLLQKAQSDLGAGCYLDKNFKTYQIPESTKEIARNWFYKIASVREMLPRFYVEAALLSSYQFISSNEYEKILVRLAEMCRGIGDPLVAIYARCYLCNIGISLDPKFKEHVWRCFHDTMTSFESISKKKKNDLYQPALEFIVQCLTYQCSVDDIGTVMEYCNQKQSTLLTTSVLRSIPPKYIAENVLEWLKLIKTSTNASYGYDWTKHPTPTAQMLRRIGEALLICEPRPDELLKILREAWKSFMRCTDNGGLESYMYCAEVWIEFASKHFGSREVNTLLDDIVRNIYPDKQYEKFYAQILIMLSNVLRHLVPKYGFNTVLNMERFVGFMDLLQKEDVKAEAAKEILTNFCKYTNPLECDDLLIANHMLNYARILHDNLTALSPDDERRQIGKLICKMLDRFGFVEDFEQQLTLYVDARGFFCNLDAVVVHLVHLVNTLAIRTRDKVYGRHTRKTASFVRACVAYTFITIPSIMDHFVRLKLYVESTSVALVNNCLAQADAILKSAISLLLDVPPMCKTGETKQKSTESSLIEIVQELLSLLLIAPDSPELGILYLFDGLCNAATKYPWLDNSDGECIVLMKCLVFLSSAVQNEYPYSIENVESNDKLYGGDERFIKRCRDKGAEIIERVLDRLKLLGQQKQYKRQSYLCLDLFDIMVKYGDLNRVHLLELTVNLWNLSRKYDQFDNKRCIGTVNYVRKRSNKLKATSTSNDTFWFKLLNKIEGS